MQASTSFFSPGEATSRDRIARVFCLLLGRPRLPSTNFEGKRSVGGIISFHNNRSMNNTATSATKTGTPTHNTNTNHPSSQRTKARLLRGPSAGSGCSPDSLLHHGIGGRYGQLQVSLPGSKLGPQRVNARLPPAQTTSLHKRRLNHFPANVRMRKTKRIRYVFVT